jgi:hypothetical protein
MTLLLITGAVVVLILGIFFYRTANLDIAGSIIAALICTALLGFLFAVTIYGSRLFF